MKQYIHTMVLGLIISACTNSENTSTVISVLEDTTEINFVAKPNAENTISLFGFDADLWRGATFRYGRINSLVHNSRDLVFVQQENALLGNEIDRRRLVSDFKKGVQLVVDKPKDSSMYKHSSIWLPILEELKVLQKNYTDDITLWVFSDLQENTKWFSVFNVADIHLLKHQRDAVVDLFLSKSEGMKPSNAIKVVVVYQPRTIAEDELFQKLKQLYLELFSKLGISIRFTANANGTSFSLK